MRYKSISLLFALVTILLGNKFTSQCFAIQIKSSEIKVKPSQQEADNKTEEEVDLRPFFIMPKLPTPPVIDGKINKEEWKNAAAVTGFSEIHTQKFASRQTLVYSGYDNEKLYFGFRCPHEGNLRKGKPTRGERGDNPNQIDDIEIRIVPPDGKVRRFVGWPAGGMIIKSEAHGEPWDANWEFKSNVESAGETIGGILSFYRKIWSSEIAVPFKDLGVACPKDGEKWHINFTRSFSVESGNIKKTIDWTSWSPIVRSFAETEYFGTVVFGSETPTFQCKEIGNLMDGQLAIKGFCQGDSGTIQVQSKICGAEGTDKILSFRSTDTTFKDNQQKPFSITDNLKVTGSMDATLEIFAKETGSNRLLAHSIIPFTVAPPLRVKLIPIVTKGELYAEVDATRLNSPPEIVSIEAAVYKGDSRMSLSVEDVWRNNRLQGEFKLDIGSLSVGEYKLEVSLKEKIGGKVLTESTEKFIVPKRPEWLGNSIGISDKVPPPWHPIELKDGRVCITQREYTLGSTGLPKQVNVLGKELFAETPKLSVAINGSKVLWELKEPQLQQRKDGQIIWLIQTSAGKLELTGKLTIEFDGFALLDFIISSDEPLTIDELFLEFPFKKERSLYAAGQDATGDMGYCPVLLDYDGELKTTKICTRPFNLGEWTLINHWFDNFWVGDDDSGFSVMCQTQENLKGTKRTAIERKGKVNTLKIYLIDGPSELSKPIEYEYMWQATPVKPRPDNPKIWHTANRPRNMRRKDLESAEDHLYMTTDYIALKWHSYPAHRYSQSFFDKRNKIYHKKGVKLVPYTGANMATMEVPELQPFLPEWETYPHKGGQQVWGKWQHSCLTTSWADYYLDFLKKAIDDLGFDGLYHDVSKAAACKNHYHGCGYQLPRSDEWHPIVNILATRRFYKRMYTFLKSDGRNGVLMRHVMPVAAIAGFVDVVFQAEEWAYERENQYDNLTPEIFRAREMRTQYGTPYLWYAFHHYHRGIKYGGRVPLSAILTYCLPHRVLPLEGRAGMWRLWKVTDEFWTSSEFLPYWSPDSPVKITEEKVLGSVYLKKADKKALLVVANWNTKPHKVQVKIDMAKLGFNSSKVSIKRALEHPILHPNELPTGDRMCNEPIDYCDELLKLELHGRNLELLIIEENDTDI